jgi:hypothetical protein
MFDLISLERPAVVEAVAAVGGDGVEVLLGDNVVAAPGAPPITMLGGDAGVGQVRRPPTSSPVSRA